MMCFLSAHITDAGDLGSTLCSRNVHTELVVQSSLLGTLFQFLGRFIIHGSSRDLFGLRLALNHYQDFLPTLLILCKCERHLTELGILHRLSASCELPRQLRTEPAIGLTLYLS